MRTRFRATRSAPAIVAVTSRLVLLSACGGEAPGGGVTITDSAGITVVENRAPVAPRGTAFTIAAPLLDLGGDESVPGATFERTVGVLLLTDGGIVMADERASEVRAFGPDGSLRWRTGRAGDGPGEFRRIASLGRGPADSIWVFDFGARRFTILDAAGTLARTVEAGAALSSISAAGRLADGSFIMRELWSGRIGSRTEGSGLIRDPAAIVRLSADGRAVDTVAVRPGREVWFTVEDGRGVMNTPLFSRYTVVEAQESRVFVGDQATFVIDVYDGRGARMRSIRIAGLDLRVDPDVARRAVDALVDPLPEADRAAAREWLENMPEPDTRPAFDRILVAGSGELWVSEHVPPPLEPGVWHVFDDSGRWLGDVTMPGRFRLEAVAAGRVAGVWRDELDVEHVRVYALERNEPR